tara:strand:+ start:399 stop:572 length:174 start_codon:yes stop_codon:yes gene_type:complete
MDNDGWDCSEPGPEGPCGAVDPQFCRTHAEFYGPDADDPGWLADPANPANTNREDTE